jgi:hypothetical protein
MELAKKLITLIDEGYDVRFSGDDFTRGLKIRVSKSGYTYEEFIGYEVLCAAADGSDYVIMYVINKLVHKLNNELKGRVG